MSQAWYVDNREMKIAKSTTRQLVSRRYTQAEQDALLVALQKRQGQPCACCPPDRTFGVLKIDWDPTARSGDGGPVTRGVTCNSCKIALGRIRRDGEHRPTSEQMAWITAYLERPLLDPRRVMPSITPLPADKRAWLDEAIERNRARQQAGGS